MKTTRWVLLEFSNLRDISMTILSDESSRLRISQFPIWSFTYISFSISCHQWETKFHRYLVTLIFKIFTTRMHFPCNSWYMKYVRTSITNTWNSWRHLKNLFVLSNDDSIDKLTVDLFLSMSIFTWVYRYLIHWSFFDVRLIFHVFKNYWSNRHLFAKI